MSPTDTVSGNAERNAGNRNSSVHERRVETPSRDFKDVPEILRAGQVARIPLPLGNEKVLSWSLEDWLSRYADVQVNTHRFIPELESRLQESLAPDAQAPALSISAAVKSYRNTPEFKKRKGTFIPFKREPHDLRTLMARAKKFEGKTYEPIWYDDPTSVDDLRSEVERMAAYGVVNARRFAGLKLESGSTYDPWTEVFNFLWFGLSPGGLHFDEFDNTLFQLKGTKAVLIFDVRHTDDIDGSHYPTSINVTRPLASEACKANAKLKTMKFHAIDLKPGEGVVIPARAYHAAFATSYDSISLNAFLMPTLLKKPAPYDPRAGVPAPISLLMRASRKAYSVAKRGFATFGPYEFI